MTSVETRAGLRELIVCSLEEWNDVWRRNQFFVDILLRRNPSLHVLFVEPPADVLHDLSQRRVPALPRSRGITPDGRLRAIRPLKALPRRVGPLADALLLMQVRLAARAIGFSRPILWINDVTYAPLIRRTSWPSVYDITDDWLLAPFAPRELERLRQLDQLALEEADRVVVCSPALSATRGARREVAVIPNGVDVDHFRAPHPRPADLPRQPTAVYVGSLHDARLDIDLVVELARSLPELSLVFVGENSLLPGSLARLSDFANVLLLGPRPYTSVPAYLQHADVIIIPHVVSQFTESLDPIKVYECLAVRTPTVATPVAGFREHSGELMIAHPDEFVRRVAATVANPPRPNHHRAEPIGWTQRVRAFEEVLLASNSLNGVAPTGRG